MMKKDLLKIHISSALVAVLFTNFSCGQEKPKLTDTNAALHLLMKPEYPVPYGKVNVNDVKDVLLRVYNYLEQNTPFLIVDSKSRKVIQNYYISSPDAIFASGDFRLISYEWGVTYAGMLNAGVSIGDNRFSKYTIDRMKFIAQLCTLYKKRFESDPKVKCPIQSVLEPQTLNDAGSVCVAMIKTLPNCDSCNLRALIDNYMNYITTRAFRLPDGSLAHNQPQLNTLWLDDLFMSVPALALMGKLSWDNCYFDDAVRQVLQFSRRMFVPDKGLFMHGWVQEMEPHRVFHWARANSWAFMAMAELLDVLPENYPGRPEVLKLFQANAKGLADYQSGTGFWHQLIDRNDSYPETSATAIYAYCFAKGINRSWLDPVAYGWDWNAVSTKVNEKGQVEGTCVGTGMGFDAAFYYYRPVSVYVAHSYGPILLAGSEMIRMINSGKSEIIGNALQFNK